MQLNHSLPFITDIFITHLYHSLIKISYILNLITYTYIDVCLIVTLYETYHALHCIQPLYYFLITNPSLKIPFIISTSLLYTYSFLLPFPLKNKPILPNIKLFQSNKIPSHPYLNNKLFVYLKIYQFTTSPIISLENGIKLSFSSSWVLNY